MFKLYFNFNGWERVGEFGFKDEKGKYDTTLRFYSEGQVIEMIKYIAKKYNRYYFMIVENVYDTDDIVACIRNEEDFNEYIQSYNTRKIDYEDMSCVDLKRLILRGKKL